jgi:hypothetical protein
VPAQDRDGAGLGQASVGDGLELGGQHVVGLVVEVELREPLGHRQPIEPFELAERGERRVWLGQRLPDAVDEPVPAAQSDRVALLDRAGAALVAHVPVGATGVLADRDREPGSRQLRERVRLVPVHPRTAVLDREPVPVGAPGAPAEPVTRLEQQRPAAPDRALASGCDTGEAAAHDDDVIALGHQKVYKRTVRHARGPGPA